jgi:predicted CoA-binding protein
MTQTVVVMGASPKPHRYSNRALRLLREHGYDVIPVHPRVERIEGLEVAHRLQDIDRPIDTLTLYIGPARVQPLIEDIVAARPRRVIINPGTEDAQLLKRLEDEHIAYEEGCTIVMLQHGTFETTH